MLGESRVIMGAEGDGLWIVALLAFVLLWWGPAVHYTIKMRRSRWIGDDHQKKLLVYLWLAPLLGTIVCMALFSRTGKLHRLSDDEHTQVWVEGEDV